MRFGFFLRRKVALAGFFFIALLLVVAVAAPFLARIPPQTLNPVDKLQPPGGAYLFGTDNFGRDVFSRVVYGARTSLTGGAGVVLFSTVLGVLIGAVAGYFRRTEAWLMRLVDVMMAFPPLLLALVLVSILGRGMVNVIVAVGVTYLTRTVRVVYALTLRIREEPYIEAAIASGVRPFDVVARHVIPNMLSPIIVQATFTFAFSLLDLAALDFLGLGIPPAVPSWGNMLSEGRMYLTRAPWLLIFPGASIVMTVLSFNLAGDVLRDRLDPQLRRKVEGV
ncbi:MAG: ABC transporter permease [Synergistaceae bacterium]|jgi:peptide/nickel transport system permease protein|nr:ABC transporter permease [Synergistaceae bacterium]